MEAVQTLENLEPADIIFSDSAAKKVSINDQLHAVFCYA
jgi:hypothetical protein